MMRLELRNAMAIPQKGAPKWHFERGRRTIGRAGDCDWQMDDPKCRISKHHCTIERDREGFLLRDQSANGSLVDGRMVLEGESARLFDRSRLEVGGLAFDVHITGKDRAELDDPHETLRLSDETLTISSILADVAPAGAIASGVLGERHQDDWPLSGAVAERPGRSSRNVEIGWSGPPQIEGMTPILPSDWDADLDTGSALEHVAATRIAVPLRQRDVARQAVDAAVEIADGAGQHAADESATSALEATRADQQADLGPRVRQLEDAFAETLAILDLETGDLGIADALLPGASLDARLEGLLAGQMALNRALDSLLKEASRTMEPRRLEAAAGQASWLPRLRQQDYWKAYRTIFEADGKSLSVREVFRRSMIAGQQMPPESGLKGPSIDHEE
jgi:type VI secretion system protein ImpI